MNNPIVLALKNHIEADDLAAVAELLEQHRGGLVAMASKDCLPGHILTGVKSIAMADLFLRHGMTTEMVNEWWAPGFGLNGFPPLVADHLIQRGAVVTPHAAAALGLVNQLRVLLDQQPELVHAKGGDGAIR